MIISAGTAGISLCRLLSVNDATTVVAINCFILSLIQPSKGGVYSPSQGTLSNLFTSPSEGLDGPYADNGREL